MSWTLSSGDFLRAGIIVYVSMWVYLRFREWNANRRLNSDVFQVSTYERRGKLIKSLGWIVALLIALAGIIIFPEIYIVSQDKPAYTDDPFKESLMVRESFNVKRKYVPFYYNGNGCAPFCKFISNETDSTLVLYLTQLYNDAYIHVSSPEYFEEVPTHRLKKWDNGLYNSWFKKPYGTWHGYIPKDKRNRKTDIWTLDLREFAERDSKDIWFEIQKHKTIWHYPDSITINGKFRIPFPKPDT